MTSTYKPFDFNRFGRVLKYDLTTERRSIAGKFAAMAGVFVLLNLLMGLLTGEVPSDGESTLTSTMNYMTASVFWALGGSCVAANMTSARKRINSLMLPASHLEKYLTRVLIWCVGTAVMTVVCIVVAGVISNFVYTRQIGVTTWPLFLDMFGGKSAGMSTLWVVGSAVMSIGMYALGSTFWPKNAFLKTFLLLCILQMAMALLLSVLTASLSEEIVTMLDSYVKSEHTVISMTDIKAVQVWLVGGQMFIGLFCLTLGYFRQKESEVIERM